MFTKNDKNHITVYFKILIVLIVGLTNRIFRFLTRL